MLDDNCYHKHKALNIDINSRFQIIKSPSKPSPFDKECMLSHSVGFWRRIFLGGRSLFQEYFSLLAA